MNKKTIILLFQVLVCPMIVAMQKESEYPCSLAQPQHVPELLELINTHARNDSDRIVIVPKKFREQALLDNIKKGKLFVVKHKESNKVIGYKKLFVFENQKELEDVGTNEIRCSGPDTDQKFSGIVSDHGNITQTNASFTFDPTAVFIYNGNDYTHPDHRSRGINTKLTNFALAHVHEKIKQLLAQKHAHKLIMLYGLTNANAGKQPGQMGDRTPSIARSFSQFSRELNSSAEMKHFRFKAFMPTFDPEAHEPKPLSDEYSIPGYGCILETELENIGEQNE